MPYKHATDGDTGFHEYSRRRILTVLSVEILPLPTQDADSCSAAAAARPPLVLPARCSLAAAANHRLVLCVLLEPPPLQASYPPHTLKNRKSPPTQRFCEPTRQPSQNGEPGRLGDGRTEDWMDWTGKSTTAKRILLAATRISTTRACASTSMERAQGTSARTRARARADCWTRRWETWLPGVACNCA